MTHKHTTIHPKLFRSRDFESTLAGLPFWEAVEVAKRSTPQLAAAHVLYRDRVLLRLGHRKLNGDILLWHGEYAGKGSLHVDFRAGDEHAVDSLVNELAKGSGLRQTSQSGDPDCGTDYECLAVCIQHAIQWGMPSDFLVTEEALEQAIALSFERYDDVISDISELTEIRVGIEDGTASQRWSRERLAQYTRDHSGEFSTQVAGQDVTLPHQLCIPCPDSGNTLRVHYAWDQKNRLHIIGGFDTYQDC